MIPNHQQLNIDEKILTETINLEFHRRPTPYLFWLLGNNTYYFTYARRRLHLLYYKNICLFCIQLFMFTFHAYFCTNT